MARKNRGYKISDENYLAAKERADKEKFPLANIIENVVTAYGYGMDIKAVKTGSGKATAFDIFTTSHSVTLSKKSKKDA